MSVVIHLAVLPIHLLLTGWVVSTLWRWFVVPLGLAPLGLAHAIGVAILVGVLAKQFQPSYDDTIDQAVGAAMFGVVFPLMSLAAGWVVLQFGGVA